jgi:hypothetical protein
MKRVIAIIAILMFIITACNGSSEDNKEANAPILGSTSGNISHGGLMCGQDDLVAYRSEADSWSLYVYDGQEHQKISDDKPASINIVDDTIYFANYSEGFKLYRISVNGDSRKKLTDYGVTNVNVIDDSIYYINRDDGFYLSKIDINGENKDIILEERVGGLVTDGNHLYYKKPVDNGFFDLFRIDFDGENEVRLTNGHYVHFINVVEDYIFYWSVNEQVLRRIDKETLENIVLIDTNVDYVNANNGYVYFLYAKDYYNIYRVDYNGQGLMKVTNFPMMKPDTPSYFPSSIFVINSDVYFRSFSHLIEADALSVIRRGEQITIFDTRIE